MARPVLWRRMVLAILLMAGFYTLALGIAGILVYLPWAEWHYLGRVEPRLLLFAGAGAITILAAITPRPDRFLDPGPTLLPGTHPRLFELIHQTAGATSLAPPSRVYLVPEFNAWVAQRGGIMGIGSERVMGLGLPLLQSLTVSEFKAVLAHEFGHFYGGDTALGPWLYTTRAAIGRTLTSLSHKSSFISKPFEWYGNAFLRVTHSVSRQQEFAADALAASVVNPDAVRSGLKAIHRLAPAYSPFWQHEVAPALSAGFRPPILEGFQSFIEAPHLARNIEEEFQNQLSQEAGDPYDTHPSLKERLAALPESEAGSPAPSEPLALSLLSPTEPLEEVLISSLAPPGESARLTPVSWSELGDKVWIPRWTEIVSENRDRLAGLHPEDLPRYADDPAELAVRLGMAAEKSVAGPRHIFEAKFLASAALTLALNQRNFLLSTMPGHPVTLTRGEVIIASFTLWDDLHEKRLSGDQWVLTCAEAGIQGMDLTAVVQPSPAGKGNRGT